MFLSFPDVVIRLAAHPDSLPAALIARPVRSVQFYLGGSRQYEIEGITIAARRKEMNSKGSWHAAPTDSNDKLTELRVGPQP
jgi:hypothetical protein